MLSPFYMYCTLCPPLPQGNLGHLIQLWNSVPRSAPPIQFAELLLKINPTLLKQGTKRPSFGGCGVVVLLFSLQSLVIN